MNAASGTRTPHAVNVNVPSTNRTSPAPRSAPDSDACTPSAGSANANTRSRFDPVSTTSGSSTNSRTMCGASRNCSTAIVQSAQNANKRTRLATASAMSGRPAPRYWPTSAVAAVPSAKPGRIASSSERSASECAASCSVPSRAMIRVYTRNASMNCASSSPTGRPMCARRPNESRDTRRSRVTFMRTGAAPLAASASASTPPAVPAVA